MPARVFEIARPKGVNVPKKAANKNDWQQRDPALKREQQRYEHPVPSRELILQDLQKQGRPMTRKQLANHFGLTVEAAGKALDTRIAAMLRDGQLVENRRGALGPLERMDLVRGRVQGHRDGFGFLIPDEPGEDVFLNPRQMRELMHGDRAVVRITGSDNRGRREGRVVDVLERAHTRIVGRYSRQNNFGLVIPDNSRIQHDIVVPDGEQGDARDGQVVTVELVEPPRKRGQPTGRVIEVLGEHLDPGLEIDIAVRAHGIPHEWPEEALAQARSIGDVVPAEHYANRVDLRDLPLVTIDGEDAKDFDDAVHCAPTAKGWKLWVAIADVSAYVAVDSPLDAEAQSRGTSVYFPGHVVPMLPEALSNGLCSLNPKVDRLCMVCEMQINAEGETTKSSFYPAVINSHARLTYTQVGAYLEHGDHKAVPAAIAPHLDSLEGLFNALFAARRRRGAIEFDSTETRIVFNEQRKIDRIEPVSRNVAHRLIEECMIAANVTAARFLARKKMPTLYRVHPGPEADRLQELRDFLAERGLSLGGGSDPEPRHFARVLELAGAREDARLIQTVLMRSLTRAVYTPDNSGHFGLALEHYAHFTSPIRRYPDLLVHRAIRHVLDGGTPDQFDYSGAAMEALGAGCSAAESRADEATRDVDDWLKCEYMRDHLGEEFGGIITGVTPFGLFVEIDDVYASGLIHVSSLQNDYYHFDATAHRLQGERSGMVHRLADRVRVKVARVDLDERKIDFEPAGLGGARKSSAKPAGRGPRKQRKKRR